MSARTVCAVWGCPQLASSRDGRCPQHRRIGGRRWRRLGQLVRARASGHCEHCGQRAKLAIHHTRTLVVTGSAELTTTDELLALCPRCHADQHPGLPGWLT